MVTLRVSDSGGALHEQVVAQADVPRLLREARSALEHGGSVVIQGKRTPATPALVEQLEALSPPPARAEDQTSAPKRPLAEEPAGQPRQQAAVIREREGSGHGVAALSLAGMASGVAGGPAWMKLAEALRQAAATGRPIALYTNVDSEGGSC